MANKSKSKFIFLFFIILVSVIFYTPKVFSIACDNMISASIGDCYNYEYQYETPIIYPTPTDTYPYPYPYEYPYPYPYPTPYPTPTSYVYPTPSSSYSYEYQYQYEYQSPYSYQSPSTYSYQYQTPGYATPAYVTPSGSYSVTALKRGGGSVKSVDNFIDCGTNCYKDYNSGASVTLKAYPSSAFWRFAGWSGDCSGIGYCVLTVNGAKSATATFVLRLFNYKEF